MCPHSQYYGKDMRKKVLDPGGEKPASFSGNGVIWTPRCESTWCTYGDG